MLPVFAASQRVSTVDHWLTLSLAMPGKTRIHHPTMYVADRHLPKRICPLVRARNFQMKRKRNP